jgi:hypothetical protein
MSLCQSVSILNVVAPNEYKLFTNPEAGGGHVCRKVGQDSGDGQRLELVERLSEVGRETLAGRHCAGVVDTWARNYETFMSVNGGERPFFRRHDVGRVSLCCVSLGQSSCRPFVKLFCQPI